jgi:hypothetical protein
MVVFKSRKVKKVKKQRKNKTIHTKYKHHRRTLKQPKHKSYNAIQPYYNVNNRLAGGPDDVHLAGAKDELNIIASTIYQGGDENKENGVEFMNEHVTYFIFSYENIETYEDKLKVIDLFKKWFVNNHRINKISFKYWFTQIITRIEDIETAYPTGYEPASANSVIKLILLEKIAEIKTIIDSS